MGFKTIKKLTYKNMKPEDFKSFKNLHIVFDDKLDFTSFFNVYRYDLENTVLINGDEKYFVDRGLVMEMHDENIPKTLGEIDFPYEKLSDAQFQDYLDIVSGALYERLKTIGSYKMVCGFSGGVDSTIALLLMVYTCERFKLGLDNIITVYMPMAHSLKKNKERVEKITKKLNLKLFVHPLDNEVKTILENVNHQKFDTTYENVQARLRTLYLMTYANKERAIVVGTGDLSECFLGWSTFNGDQMAMYNINSGLFKTTMFSLLNHFGKKYVKIKGELKDLISIPISPELKTNQNTEDLIGKFLYNDYLIYLFLLKKYTKNEILELFQKKFPEVKPEQYLTNLIKRFNMNGFKRLTAPESVKILDVSLNDFVIPGDLKGEKL